MLLKTFAEYIHNDDESASDWQFTTDDAHIELHQLYPTKEDIESKWKSTHVHCNESSYT